MNNRPPNLTEDVDLIGYLRMLEATRRELLSPGQQKILDTTRAEVVQTLATPREAEKQRIAA